jgi:hypothetical protein
LTAFHNWIVPTYTFHGDIYGHGEKQSEQAKQYILIINNGAVKCRKMYSHGASTSIEDNFPGKRRRRPCSGGDVVYAWASGGSLVSVNTLHQQTSTHYLNGKRGHQITVNRMRNA